MIVVCDPHRHCRRRRRCGRRRRRCRRRCGAAAVVIVIIAAVAVTVAVVVSPSPLPPEFPPPQPPLLLLVDCCVCLCPPPSRHRRRRHPLCRRRRHRHRRRSCRRRLMECSPDGGRRWAMTVSGRRQAAEGDRRWRLEREVGESSGRRSRRQSRTEENGYAADEVLGIGAARYSILQFPNRLIFSFTSAKRHCHTIFLMIVFFVIMTSIHH